ncbi:uncharacterized protein LOC135503112 isoform X2 [Lineus longissimus]
MIFLDELKQDNATLTVTEGDPMTIDCNTESGGVISNPGPIWSWKIVRNGSVLPLEYPRMAVDKEGKLHLAYVKLSDGDDDVSFVCWAENVRLGRTVSGSETSLIITKLPGDIPSKKPELTYSNTNRAAFYRVEVIKGQKVDLYCIFKGYPDVNITWTKNRKGDPLPAEGITLSDGDTKLTVDSSKLPDGIVLTCTGENTEGAAESLYDIIVQEPPVFIPGPLQLKSVNKTVGEEVHFQCEVKAKPSAKLEWLVDNVVISGSPSDPRMIIDSKGNFRLKDLKKTDNQVVTCRATQTFGKKQPFTFTIFKSGYINVLTPLSIAKQPKDTAMVSSFCDVIRLECHVQYDPLEKPVVTWYRNGDIIEEYPQQIYKASNESLIINATKYCLAEQIAGMYHYVATTTLPSQRIESTKCNITLDPNGNFTRAGGDGWEFLGLYLEPWWLWLLILAAIIILILILCLCCLCCCCCRQRKKKIKQRKEEDSSDLEAMLATRPEELPTKLDDPVIEQLFKKYIIIMGDGSQTEEEEVTIMPQAAFHHLITRIWPVVPYLKQEDFETCYQSHCTEGEKGLSFQSFHSSLNELINTNDSRLRDSLPARRRKNKISNFHTKEKVILMLKIVVDPERDPAVFVNDLKFAVWGLERLNFTNGTPVVRVTTEKVLNGIGYGNFWLLNIAHLTWDLVKVTMNDETSQKERWKCDCDSLQGSFDQQRWFYIHILYEVMEFLNFAKRTELYRSPKVEKYINDLKNILEEDNRHLTHSGFGEPKRVRKQVYERMANRINQKFFRRYMWKAKVAA